MGMMGISSGLGTWQTPEELKDVLAKKGLELFKELKRRYDAVDAEDYLAGAIWREDLMRLDIEMLDHHRRLAGAEDIPELDEVEIPESLLRNLPKSLPPKTMPSVPKAGGFGNAATTLKVNTDADAKFQQLVTLFSNKWSMDFEKTSKAVQQHIGSNIQHLRFIILNFKHKVEENADVNTAFETFLSKCKAEDKWTSLPKATSFPKPTFGAKPTMNSAAGKAMPTATTGASAFGGMKKPVATTPSFGMKGSIAAAGKANAKIGSITKPSSSSSWPPTGASAAAKAANTGSVWGAALRPGQQQPKAGGGMWQNPAKAAMQPQKATGAWSPNSQPAKAAGTAGSSPKAWGGAAKNNESTWSKPANNSNSWGSGNSNQAAKSTVWSNPAKPAATKLAPRAVQGITAPKIGQASAGGPNATKRPGSAFTPAAQGAQKRPVGATAMTPAPRVNNPMVGKQQAAKRAGAPPVMTPPAGGKGNMAPKKWY